MTGRTTPDAVDWTTVVAEHEPRLRRVVARRVPAGLIDDVVQETFLRAYRSRSAIDLDRPIGPWLTTIAIRVAADLTRHTPITGTAVPACLLSVAGADVQLATIERVALIRRALAALSPRHRQLLESVALDGVSQVALAQREGVPPEVIRSTVLRARQRFRIVYERLAQEHGLVGLGGSIKPVLGTLRARLLPMEAAAPRKAKFAAAVLGLAAAGGLILGAPDPNATQRSADVSALDAPPRSSTALKNEGDLASPLASNRAVRMRTAVPGGDIGGGISSRAPLEFDTFWTLQLHHLGINVVVGTTETEGRMSAEFTTNDKGLGTSAGVTAHGSCEAGPTRPKVCSVFDIAEHTLRTAERSVPLRGVAD